MAQAGKRGSFVTFKVDLEKPFTGELVAYAFDAAGQLLATETVQSGALKLPLSEKQARHSRVFIAPRVQGAVSLRAMERLGAHEVQVAAGLRAPLASQFIVPGSAIARWPFCFCTVRGNVVRPVGTPGNTQDRPVCGARVHICEVDPFPIFIAQLPDLDLFRLRDDLLRAVATPRIPRIPPEDPFPGPRPGPGPDPAPFFARSPLRLQSPGAIRGFNPQPEPPQPVGAASTLQRVALNPQPLPPKGTATLATQGSRPNFSAVQFNPQPEPPEPFALARIQGTALPLQLSATNANALRSALLANVELIRIYICLWPWWWHWFRCDEVAVVETDALGHFETLILYNCNDQPDLYFWVEYSIGGVWQTVYNPPVACYTYWNYACGTPVTIRVTDPRVPACGDDPDLGGMQVAVMSIGNNVSLSEIQTAGVTEGLTSGGAPFGGRLEPHVWFSRSNLIAAGITQYRWSWRRLTGPDGVTPDVGAWSTMTRQVGRHYAVDDGSGTLSFPFEVLGPSGSDLFRIQPIDPPAPGIDWVVLDAREDSATAFFETTALPHGLAGTPTECQKAAVTAGKYELRLQMYNAGGTLVDWTAAGIGLKIASDPAPFGTGTVNTIDAPAYNRILDGALHLVGFRMVVRVDNNCCRADIHAISGAGLTVDADCGFIEYAPGSSANISFDAEHPHDFATFGFGTQRGLNSAVPQASASGVAGAPTAASTGGAFVEGPAFHYSKAVAVSTLLTVNTPSGSTPCDRAAFAEVLNVWAMATDGWSRLSHLDRSDVAAFALSTPCECE